MPWLDFHAAGLGHAAVGMVLLAGLTSLPEVAVTLSAAVAAMPHLAVNNLLGSIAMQITVLACYSGGLVLLYQLR